MGLARETNEEAVAKFPAEQSRGLPQIARRRQDIKLMESQLRRPDQMRALGAVGDRRKENRARTEKGGKGPPNNRYEDQSGKCEYFSRWKPEGRSRYFKGRDSEKSRDYVDGRKKRQREGSDGNTDDRRIPKQRKKEDRSRSKGQARSNYRDAK